MFSPGIILRSVTFVVSVDFLGAVFARGYSGVRVAAFSYYYFTDYAKSYLKIRTGSHDQVILTVFLGFGRPPLLDSRKTGRIKNELALVNQ